MIKGAIILVVGICLGVGLGNLDGDQATVRECASSGKAEMMGGSTIKCEVVKDDDAIE